MFLPVASLSNASATSGAETNPTTSGADGLANAAAGHVVNRAKLRMNWLLSVSSDCARIGTGASIDSPIHTTAAIRARRPPVLIVICECIRDSSLDKGRSSACLHSAVPTVAVEQPPCPAYDLWRLGRNFA